MIYLVQLRYYPWFAPVSIFLLFYSTIYLVNFKKEIIKNRIINIFVFLVSYLFLIWPLSMANSTILKNIPSSFFENLF